MGDLFSTLKDLVDLGFAGVGIAVFLLVFILLIRDKPIEERKAKLYEKFMVFGVGFAVFCGVVSVFAPLLDSRPNPPGSTRLRLAFSPDFNSQSLPPPRVHLPDGTQAQAGATFDLPASSSTQVLQVVVDDALRQVQGLRSTTTQLTQSVQVLREQRDTLAASIPVSAAAPQAQREIRARSAETERIEERVAAHVRAGEFMEAANATRNLKTHVNASREAVQALARPRDVQTLERTPEE